MDYPNRIIRIGDSDKFIVKAIQSQLNDVGCGKLDVDGIYGQDTFEAIKLFQTRSVDENGNPLIVDGRIGGITWTALFGDQKTTISSNVFLNRVVMTAKSQVGVIEHPVGSNSGPEVNLYLASVGLDPGYFWCAAFVYWCFDKTAFDLKILNPALKSAGVMEHWISTKGKKITTEEAINDPSKLIPGQVFIMSYGEGKGHTGIVESVSLGFVNTIEGNTNEAGSRNGIGVFKRRRKINSINKGFIEYQTQI